MEVAFCKLPISELNSSLNIVDLLTSLRADGRLVSFSDFFLLLLNLRSLPPDSSSSAHSAMQRAKN